MPHAPQPRWRSIVGEQCLVIDWRHFFRIGDHELSGQMRSFQIVFEIRVIVSGRLLFWSDDGCIIEKDGLIIHEDRTAHPPKRSEIPVVAGDRLRIAHWQLHGDWLWGAQVVSLTVNFVESLLEFLPQIERRLQGGCGPCLKMFTNGATGLRAILALYSMILNGYTPNKVVLFGEHQWSSETKSLFSRCLPFAKVIPTSEVMWAVREAGGIPLVSWSAQNWWVMKACVALFTDPREFCMMDDDVFVLSSVKDALEFFSTADLVYQGDLDHGDTYRTVWGSPGLSPLPTGRFNAGLYWMRNVFEAHTIARRMSGVPPQQVWHVAWEQGFIATLFASCRSKELSSHCYFHPHVDGLPGGILGYDYRNNPCGFKTIHFGGLSEKPLDAAVVSLAHAILPIGASAL
jgi:hypothetical protein